MLVDKDKPISESEPTAPANDSREQPPPYPTDSPNTFGDSSGTTKMNNYWLYSSQHKITGTYIIDPSLPGSSLKECDPDYRMPYSSDHKKFLPEKHTPNVFFVTKQCPISLNLSVESGSKGQDVESSKVHMLVRSREGDVNVNLTSIQENHHVCLELSTRNGQTILFLPPTFDGFIHICNGRAPVEILSECAKHTRIVYGSDEASLIRFSPSNGSDSPLAVTEQDLQSSSLDHCLLGGSRGRIVIGISGMDHYEPPVAKTGLQKIFGA
ncbi:hypothetical protein ABKN59_004801 [Abortiporus biennis]